MATKKKTLLPVLAAPAATEARTPVAAAVKETVAKPVKTAKPPKAAGAPKADKAEKARKPKLVRDSFTIPKAEYAVLDALKQRAAKLGRPAKKSEVLRAGVQALAAMADDAFLATLGGVPTVKTGRPAKS